MDEFDFDSSVHGLICVCDFINFDSVGCWFSTSNICYWNIACEKLKSKYKNI